MNMQIRKAGLIIYIFLAVFAPPIFKFNIIYILSLISILYIIGKRRRICFEYNKKIIQFISAILLYIFVVICISQLFGDIRLGRNRLVFVYQLFVLIPMQWICAYGIKLFAYKHNIYFSEIVDLCIGVGILQSVLVVLAFAFPTVQKTFLDIMIENGGKVVYKNIGLSSYRAYGFADTLLDTFGYGMGLLGGFCILKKKQNIFSIIAFILISFSIALNSRTGIAILMVALLVKMINGIKKSYKIKSIFRFILVFIALVIFCFMFTKSKLFQSQTIQWIIAGFESVWSFVTGKKMAYRLGSMQNSMFKKGFWQFPEDPILLLFGKGHTIFGTRAILGIQTDVGYVNYIWVCGILGTVILMFIIGYIFYKCYKKNITEYGKSIFLFLAISFYLVFIKGNVLTHTAGTFTTILCLVMYKSGFEAEVYSEKK